MADRKISDLTALTTPASGDYLPIVDISEASAANKNKRITIEELLRGAPDGTAGAPGIGFESDPNTGIYSPGADALGLVTAGTERLRITSAGLVGIGTSSVGDVLHVKGGSTYAGVIADNSAATGGGAFRAYRNGVQKAIFCVDSWVTGTSSDDAAIYADTGGGIKFYTNNSSTAKAVLTSGGSLGIGTSDPGSYGANLAVIGSGDGIIAVGQATSYTTFQSNGQDFYLNAKGTGGTVFRRGSGDTESARLDGSGRLLVGTSSDSGGALLQVNGNRIRVATAKTPSSASDTGTAGEICWDADYIYVCTATNTWKRTAISTWP